MMALAGLAAKLLGQFSDNFDLDGYPSSQLCENKVEPIGIEPTTSRVRF